MPTPTRAPKRRKSPAAKSASVRASGGSTSSKAASNSRQQFKAGLDARRKTRLYTFIAIAITGGVLIPLGVMVGVLDTYGQADRAQRADAIVVLGAHVRKDGSAGYGLQSRVLHALSLYQKGVAPKIICTGGVGDNPPAEAEVAAKILVERGVPRGVILLENKSTSTWENAAYAAELCRANNIKRIVVVSDPFHLWRAERNFGKQGLVALGSPVGREQWRSQPLKKVFWTTREAILVLRDFVMRRV